MKNLSRLITIILMFVAWSGCQPQTDRLPNIVIIFADDMGYGDLSSQGAAGFKTPNLDLMANEGMRFTHFYSVQAVCSASRAALLTGCYPNRIGVRGALFPHSKVGLNPDELTIAEMLKPLGFATGIFGKWHLGHLKEFLPLQHGFDEYVGIPYSNDMWPVDYDGNQVDTVHRKTRFPQLPLIEGNEKVRELRTLEDQAEITTLYTERAVRFIRKNAEQPFFLYVPYTMPHVPLAVSSKFKGKSEQGLYGDVIMEIDWSVGEILKTIKEEGLDENTLVIFTSDNGPWLNFGNHAGTTGGLREGKGTSWEGGQREPTVMRWPGTIPAGEICNKIAATIDIMPTLAAITGGQLPDHKIDGVNILSLLEGDPEANPRDHLYYYYRGNSLEAVRKDKWKLVFPHPYRTYENQLPGNDGHPGPQPEAQFDSLALFDLIRDPGERYNVIELYPDVVDELQALAEVARSDLGDDLQGRDGSNVRPVGRIQ